MQANVIKNEDSCNREALYIKEEPPEDSANLFDFNKSVMVKIKKEDELDFEPTYESLEDPSTLVSNHNREAARKITAQSEDKPEEQSFTVNYPCKYCKKVYKTMQGKKDHERTHIEDIPICKICKKSYSTHSNLFQHMKVHTSQRFQCDLCKEEFVYKQTLKKHLLRKHLDQKHTRAQCGICAKFYNNRSHLHRHIQNVHLKHTQFDCHLCDKKLRKKSSLRTHLAVAHEVIEEIEARFSYKVCNTSYYSKRDLEVHRDTHGNRTRTKQVSIETKEVMNESLASNTIVKEEVIIDDSQFDPQHSPTQNGRYRCDICDKTYAQRHSLTTHLEIHVFGSYECDICGEKYTRKDSLLRHMCKNHLKYRKTSRKENQRNKKKTSRKESKVEVQEFINELEAKRKQRCNSFVCHVCGRRFDRSNTLVMHTRTHQAKVKVKARMEKEKKIKDDKDFDESFQHEEFTDFIDEVINIDNDPDTFHI